MRVAFAFLALFAFLGIATRSSATTDIDAVLVACKTVVSVEDQQLCESAIGLYIGETRSMERRAAQVTRHLGRAAKYDRIDAGSILIGLKIVQKSEMSKSAKNRAISNAIQFVDLRSQLNPSFQNAPDTLIRALGTEKDGFELVTSEGSTYSIISTYASPERLCRVVSLETSLAFAIESFCKIKGGEWR